MGSPPKMSDAAVAGPFLIGGLVGLVVLIVLTCLLYCCYTKRRDKKKKKPPAKRKRRPPNVISHLHGNENLAGPQHQRGITVTNQSGVHYTHQQQQQQQQGTNGQAATLNHTQLPPYPAPNSQQGFYPGNQGNGHLNNGYNNQFGQVAQPQQPTPQGLLQQQRAHIQMRVNDSPMGVSSNPMGGRRAGGGSIDTLSTNDGDNVSINSYGSTGSFNSTASINNPMRSSLKKPKNKETASVASAASKKSVRIALGEEQTAV